MPRRWNAKDERQYEHIKQAERESGVPAKRAMEIAARTVNKQRRREGRTLNKKTLGTGRPGKPLELRTRAELYNLARKRRIAGRSTMSKDALVQALTR